jgi:hypothetical protein
MQKSILYLTQFLTLFSIFQQGLSYFLTVDAHAEECFFDKVEVGSKLGMLLAIVILHACIIMPLHTLYNLHITLFLKFLFIIF